MLKWKFRFLLILAFLFSNHLFEGGIFDLVTTFAQGSLSSTGGEKLNIQPAAPGYFVLVQPNSPATNLTVSTGTNTFVFGVTPTSSIRIYVTNNTSNACLGVFYVSMAVATDKATTSFNNSLSNWTSVPLQNSAGGLSAIVPFDIPASGAINVTSTAIHGPTVAVQIVNTTGGCSTTNIEVTAFVTAVQETSPLISVGANGFGSGVTGNVQGVTATGTNGTPVLPVITSSVGPATNAGFNNVGIDTFSTQVLTYGSGNVTIAFSPPTPTKTTETAIAFTWNLNTGGGGWSVLSPWTCIASTTCGTTSNEPNGAFLNNFSSVNLEKYTNGNANGAAGPATTIFVAVNNSPTFRQAAQANSNPLAFGGNTASGSTLMTAIVWSGASSGVCSVADGQGNIWRQLTASFSTSGTTSGLAVWASTTTSSAAAESITATMCSGATFGGQEILELSSLTPAALNQPNQPLTSDPAGILQITRNTVTGDAGTFTASFNGAIQTNFSARGAIITILLGTVSGTTPTLAVQPQYSPDGGTTFLNFGPVLPNLTATNNTGSIIIYPTNTSTAGATPAAFTVGTTATIQSNAALPRTWRLVYTIGGTTPSFAINSVQVNYMQ